MSDINSITLDILTKTHIAKQLVFRGLAVMATHALNTLFKEKFLNVVDLHYSLQPFMSYLRPQQLAVEALRFTWDYILFKYSKGIIPCGSYSSPAHCVAFSDSCAQVFIPRKFRWIVTFFVMSNEDVGKSVVSMSAEEGRCIAVMQSLRWFGQGLFSALERKINQRTPRTWKSILFQQVTDGVSQMGTYVGCNWVFYKCPVHWRNTPIKYTALSCGTVVVGFCLNAVLMGIASQTVFMPVWNRLQGFKDPAPVPLGPLSQYHEFASMSWMEVTYLYQVLCGWVTRNDMSHSVRVHLLSKLEKMSTYIGAVQKKEVARAKSAFPLAAEEIVIVADCLTDDMLKTCADCKKEFNLGDRASKMSCGHALCMPCTKTYELDLCLVCTFSIEDMDQETQQAVYSRHDQRMSKILQLASSRPLLPEDVYYSTWLDAAHVAVQRKHISRITAYSVDFDTEYKPIDTWLELFWWLLITIIDVTPTIENNCCPLPIL